MRPTKVIAHRGGRKWAPENTLAAFRLSLEAGVDGMEFDVQRCATGELVVIHDDDVQRTTDGVGLVKDISLAELRRLSAGEWFDPKFEDEKIPTLEEVLELVDGKAVINIEVKNAPTCYPDIEDDVLDLLKSYKHMDKVIISSFDHNLMVKFRNKDKDINLAVLADALLLDLPGYAKKFQAKFWHPCIGSLTDDTVDEAHEAGLTIYPWTSNNKKEWIWALEKKIDGLVTDDPAGLIAFLDQVACQAGSL